MKRFCPHCGQEDRGGNRTFPSGEDSSLRVESRLVAAIEELARVRKSVELAREELATKEQSLRQCEEELSVLVARRKAALAKHGETLVALSAARKELGKLKREYFERYVRPHLPPEVLAEYIRLKPAPDEGGKPPGA